MQRICALNCDPACGVHVSIPQDEILETARIPFADYVALAIELKSAMSGYGGGLVNPVFTAPT